LALERSDVAAEVAGALDELRVALDRTLGRLANGDHEARAAQLQRVQASFVTYRDSVRGVLRELLEEGPLEPGDLPASLLRSFIDRSDPARPRYALEVHPKLPDDPMVTSPLHPDYLPGFINEVSAVDHEATGVIVQIYRSGDLIARSFKQAGGLALVAVFVLLLVVLRSVHDVLLCLVPVGMGFALTFGIMEFVGVPLNPANVIVLPLMFGIGVDAGVHVIHRYRQEPELRPLGLAHGTGKGITLTSLTTIIGFGAMLTAEHRGIQSLGFVMALGITLTTLACWTIVPAWLELRPRPPQPPKPRRNGC